MRKIEIFAADEYFGLQKKMQTWLDENPDAYIEELKYSSSMVITPSVYLLHEYSAVILYTIPDTPREFDGKSFNSEPDLVK